MATSPIVDLSHWNPTPDWQALRAGGVQAVILKCTEGTTYLDPTYYDRWAEANEAGVLLSSYHFLKAGNIPEQMDWFLEKCKPDTGERVCIDYEDYNVDSGGKACASIDELCQAVDYLWSVRPDLEITIYSGHVIKEQLGENRRYNLLDDTSLWIAHYTLAQYPTWPKQQWPTWSMWQYTDSEQVPGISDPVDGNRWNGSDEALQSFFLPAGGSAVTPQPEPEPAPWEIPEVLLDVTVSMSSPVRLRLRVNGEEVVTNAAPLPLVS